jgi:hypothetical protein
MSEIYKFFFFFALPTCILVKMNIATDGQVSVHNTKFE